MNRPRLIRGIKITSTVCCGIAVVVLIVWLLGEVMVDLIPPSAATTSAMTETMVRMEIYLQHNKSLPETLAGLPTRPNYLNRTTDGWGRELIYTPKDDAFSLKSLGEDGAVGGTGNDVDIERTYVVVDGVPEEVIP